jgi:hypothetical protein
MALDKELARPKRLTAHDRRLVSRHDLVEQPHWRAMGNQAFDFFATHGSIRGNQMTRRQAGDTVVV